MTFTTLLGLIGAILVNVAFLPQFIKSWKTKKTEDISLGMYSVYIVGIIIWLIYGVLIKDIPIIFSEIIGLTLVSSVLYLKLKYG